MTPAELIALAERVEAAPPEMQGRLIEQAWDAIAQHSAAFRRFATAYLSGFDNNAGKFAMCLEARAYESAAIMLVPEGIEGLPLSFKVERFYLGNGITNCRACVWDGLGGVSSLDTASEAATPALALISAALRAHAAKEQGR